MTDPNTFSFVFPNGEMKWRDEMTREELLHVIESLQSEIDHLAESRHTWRKLANG